MVLCKKRKRRLWGGNDETMERCLLWNEGVFILLSIFIVMEINIYLHLLICR